MRRLTKISLCALALAAPLYAFGTPAWISRALAPSSHVAIAKHVYAAPSVSAAERQRALAGLQAARERIAALYGAPHAQPVTIIAADNKEAGQLGLRGRVPGAAFISPVGTHVVLNMTHFSTDVTAHELAHAEFAERLGFWTRLVHLPVWFDEGLALQLDQRRGYMPDCHAIGPERILGVQRLERNAQFQEGDHRQVVANYRAAKCAVAQVLEQHPPRAVYDALARMRAGESFASVFGTARSN